LIFVWLHFSADRSDNFVIGVTNVSTEITPPVLLSSYTVCGQYPGAVAAGATVNLQCDSANLPSARHVIVQFPRMNNMFNFCELDVCAKG